jgi:hypothetical protein
LKVLQIERINYMMKWKKLMRCFFRKERLQKKNIKKLRKIFL